jgi:hypothetical protein
MSNVIHFENLWSMCEKMSEKEPLKDLEVIGRMSSVIEELRGIYKAAQETKDKNFVKGMKSKAFGRLLMNVAALSAIEDIDVYAALKEQLDII